MCNRGYNTMKGYYKNPQATAEVIDKNGFLHSGDLGVKDEDGNYRITGRIKDMIIRGGENIYRVKSRSSSINWKVSKMYKWPVSLPRSTAKRSARSSSSTKEPTCTNRMYATSASARFSRYKIPKYIFFVKEFPMTGSGKIQKFKLKDVGLQLCKEQGIEII